MQKRKSNPALVGIFYQEGRDNEELRRNKDGGYYLATPRIQAISLSASVKWFRHAHYSPGDGGFDWGPAAYRWLGDIASVVKCVEIGPFKLEPAIEKALSRACRKLGIPTAQFVNHAIATLVNGLDDSEIVAGLLRRRATPTMNTGYEQRVALGLAPRPKGEVTAMFPRKRGAA
jgi:hypothetical protein